ncbi:extracellular solute-binding protein [Streptomyces sp. B6B3]|uniref:ABC transporter substrate-binding protein n=1 Tax=Streptomyces sp. B6B3 TaxID=3153570 RepID=UPI00325E3B20
MSIRRTAICGLAVAVLGSLGLTACGSDDGGGEGGDVTLNFTWWGADERASRYEEAIDLFEAAHPNIKVQTSFAEFNDYWTQRSTDATGQSLPDVFQMDLSYIQEYGNNGLLYDMGEYAGQQLDTSTIDEQLLDAGTVNDQQVGIPLSTNTWALLINPDLLDELGVEAPDWDYTWDEFNDFLAEVAAAGADHDPQVYGGGDYTMVWWTFMQYLVQEGIEPFAENGQWNFTEQDLIDFLSLTEDLRFDGMVPAERVDQLDPASVFGSGESPADMTWDNFITNWGTELGSENVELMPPPTGSDGEKHMFFKPSMLLSMGANTEHPEEAAQLVDFLVNDTEAGQILGTDLGVPASQERLDALEVEEGSYDEKVIEYEARVRDEGYVTEPVPTPAQGFGAVEGEYVTVLADEFSYQQIDAEEFASRLFDSLETNIVVQ